LALKHQGGRVLTSRRRRNGWRDGNHHSGTVVLVVVLGRLGLDGLDGQHGRDISALLPAGGDFVHLARRAGLLLDHHGAVRLGVRLAARKHRVRPAAAGHGGEDGRHVGRRWVEGGQRGRRHRVHRAVERRRGGERAVHAVACT